MSEIIDRVAKAIYDKATRFNGDPIGVHLGQSMMIDASSKNAVDLRLHVMSICEDAAKAAIEALLIPSDTMKDHGSSVGPDTPSGQFGWDDAATVWSAMIYGALK